MKKLLLCFCVAFACADFQGYYEKFSADTKSVLAFKNPFFVDGMNEQLHLQAIFGDKAKINERWYQKDDSIEGAKILSVLPNSVLLEKDAHQFQLNIKRANHKIHIR